MKLFHVSIDKGVWIEVNILFLIKLINWMWSVCVTPYRTCTKVSRNDDDVMQNLRCHCFAFCFAGTTLHWPWCHRLLSPTTFSSNVRLQHAGKTHLFLFVSYFHITPHKRNDTVFVVVCIPNIPLFVFRFQTSLESVNTDILNILHLCGHVVLVQACHFVPSKY